MLRKTWIELRSSLWFVPGLLVLAGMGLAIGLIEVDLHLGHGVALSRWRPFLDASADGARGMLSAIAGSMITVAGVAFSVTIVTLSLASTQYTPRILRNFMRDRANQTVLGVFVGVFTYCLVVLRTIRGEEGGEAAFVPLAAVFGAVVLALVSIGFLIFFIHHTAASIQASTLLSAITEETITAMDALFPEDLGREEDPQEACEELPTTWSQVSCDRFGYLQSIVSGTLVEFATQRDVVLRLECRVGDFVMTGGALVSCSQELDEKDEVAVRDLFVIGDFQTIEQDASFGIRQIVDIAMKALSPGVNDTSTAVSCMDHLGMILAHLAQRRFESESRKEGGRLRVIAPAPTFAEYVAEALDEVRLSAKGNVTILLKMLQVILRVALRTRGEARLRTLLMHAELVRDEADQSVPTLYDRERINGQMTAMRQSLGLTGEMLHPLARHREKSEFSLHDAT